MRNITLKILLLLTIFSFLYQCKIKKYNPVKDYVFTYLVLDTVIKDFKTPVFDEKGSVKKENNKLVLYINADKDGESPNLTMSISVKVDSRVDDNSFGVFIKHSSDGSKYKPLNELTGSIKLKGSNIFTVKQSSDNHMSEYKFKVAEPNIKNGQEAKLMILTCDKKQYYDTQKPTGSSKKSIFNKKECASSQIDVKIKL